MNSIFLKELYEGTEGYASIEDRFLGLDNDIKSLLERDSLKEDITLTMDSLNLNKDYYDPIARNIAFLLLQIMRPGDLREELSNDLVDVRRDIIDALDKKIRENIINKQLMALIEKNWSEDDAEAKEVEEEIEMSLVPLPKEVEDRIRNTQKSEPLNTENTPTEMPIKSWEGKLDQINKTEETKTEVRSENNRTLPKIGLGQGDVYREIPE